MTFEFDKLQRADKFELVERRFDFWSGGCPLLATFDGDRLKPALFSVQSIM